MEHKETNSEEDVQIEGCCLRCRLRLTGRRLQQIYSYKQSEEKALSCEKSESNHDDNEPSNKKPKISICICCLGLLQPEFWNTTLSMVENEVTANGYDSETFACGLSFPNCILIREYSINLYMKGLDPKWQNDNLVPLKQAWKWSFGELMSQKINKSLDSGSISQFLITVFTKYKIETEELDILKKINNLTQIVKRNKKHKEDFSKIEIENILSRIDPAIFKEHFNCPPIEPKYAVECTSIECNHNPIYLGGRYAKFSRDLSQTPWIINGERIMEGSIQEIIFQPLINFYKIPENDVDNRLKFISSGREDVDVRCLGKGRPFAIEIQNPTTTKFDKDQLEKIQSNMNIHPNLIKVANLQSIEKNDLQLLKMGEEIKSKTYQALCIKLYDKCNDDNIGNVSVTDLDITKINTFSNATDEISVTINQKTPLRVLHRRPLLTRTRKIHNMKAFLLKEKPNMFILELTTEAGTYIKEFVHGDFGRTIPNLPSIIGSKVDILALDVKSVNLEWPANKIS